MRKRCIVSAAPILILLAGLGVAGAAPAQSVALTGPAGETRTVTLSELAAMPHQTATLVNEHGPARQYDGVPLTLLLQSVGAPAGKTLRGPAMADLVLVGASDGYRVVLALAETDPGMTPRKVLLADRADGAPLGATEGPFRLIVEGDLRPARSARMVTTIQVEAAPATN
jgi:hypothetical protein